MEMDKAEEAAREKRKRDQIAFRTKKRFSLHFQIWASLFEIVETVAIMFAMFILSAFLVFTVFKLPDASAQKVISVLMIVIFLGGMILGFIIYKKACRWYIKKFNKKDKLNDEILLHYFKDAELAQMKHAQENPVQINSVPEKTEKEEQN